MSAAAMERAGVLSLETKDIHRASCGRVLLDVFHCANHAEPCIRIVGRDIRKGDGAHPATDAGIDRDILLDIRTEVGDRVRDDAGCDVELPEVIASSCVNRLELS